MDYQQEPRQFFGGSMIQMPMADFVKEHNDLIHILRHGSKGERAAEAASQEKELKSKRGGGPRYSRLENTLDRVGDDIVNVFIDEEDRPRYDPIAEAREAEEQRERLRERREREARAADIRNNPAFNTARRRRREAQRRRAARRGRGIALSSDEEESSDEENIEGGGNSFGRMIDHSENCFRSIYEDTVAPFYTAQQYRDRVKRLNRNVRRNLKQRQKDEIKDFFRSVRDANANRLLTPTQYANGTLDLYYQYVDNFRNIGPFSEAKYKDEVRRLAEEADAEPSAPVVPLPSAPIPAWAMGDIDQNPSGVSLPGAVAVEEDDIGSLRIPTVDPYGMIGSGNVCMRGIAGVSLDDIEDARRQQAINSARELARARANPGRVFPLSEAMETPAWISPAPLSDYPPWGIYHQEQNPRPPRARRKSRRNSDPKRGRGIASSKRSAKVAPITEKEEDRGIGVGDVTLLTLKEKVDAAKKAFRAKQAEEKAAKKKSKRGVLRKLVSFLRQR